MRRVAGSGLPHRAAAPGAADARAVAQQDDGAVATQPRSGYARGDRPGGGPGRPRLRVAAARPARPAGRGRPVRPRARGPLPLDRALRPRDRHPPPGDGAGPGCERFPERAGYHGDGGPLSPNDLVSLAMTTTSEYIGRVCLGPAHAVPRRATGPPVALLASGDPRFGSKGGA